MTEVKSTIEDVSNTLLQALDNLKLGLPVNCEGTNIKTLKTSDKASSLSLSSTLSSESQVKSQEVDKLAEQLSNDEGLNSLGKEIRSDYISTPFPDEKQIGVMKFDHLNLDRSFSIETNLIRPKRVGYFSCQVDADGKTQTYSPDKSSLRYFRGNHRKNLNLNLLEGYSSDIKWGRVPPGEMHLLRWVIENTSALLAENDESSFADFICYTRFLRTVMYAAYNRRDDWTCIAVKVRGAIIIDEIDTPNRQSEKDKQDDWSNANSYAGYKFEEEITRRFDGVRRPTYIGGYRDSFYTVSKVKLNRHRLLYSTRVDCAINRDQMDKSIDEMHFYQIKSRAKTGFNNHFFWRYRIISWWIESMLGRCDHIICGIKQPGFFVDGYSKISVDRVPQEKNRWSPKTCVDFLELTLNFIKSMVKEELKSYRFHCSPGKAIVCQQIDEPVDKYLPAWFIDGKLPG